jgi:hypothetical protein
VSDDPLDNGATAANDATVATLIDWIAGQLREYKIQAWLAAKAREWFPSNARLRIVARRERAAARVGMTTRSPKSMRGDGRKTHP